MRVDSPTTNGPPVFVGVEVPFEGEIDSVYVNPEGDIVIINEEGEETVIDQHVNAETGEPENTRITDSSGQQWVVDKDGNVIQPSNVNSLVDGGAQSENSNNEPRLVVVHKGKDYVDEDIIAFPENYKKKATFRVTIRNSKTFDKSKVQWIGLSGIEDECELNMSSVKTSLTFKVIYDSKDTLEISLVKYLVQFARADESASNYGYDEFAKSDWASSGHHASLSVIPGVGSGNHTYVKLKCEDISRFEIISKDVSVVDVDQNFQPLGRNEYRVKINGFSAGDSRIGVKLKNNPDTTLFAWLDVHSYEPLETFGNLYYAFDGRFSSGSFTQSSASDIQRRARELHKFMVINPTLSNVSSSNVAFDENENGKLDYYADMANGGKELRTLINSINPNEGDAFILPHGLQLAYNISQSVKNTDMIYLEGNGVGINIGDEYSIGKPDGSLSETFTVKSRKIEDLRSIELYLQSPANYNRILGENYVLINTSGTPLIENCKVGDTQIKVLSHGKLQQNTSYVLKGRSGENIEVITITKFTQISGQRYILDLLTPLRFDHDYNPSDLLLGHFVECDISYSTQGMSVSTGDQKISLVFNATTTDIPILKKFTLQKINGSEREEVYFTQKVEVGGLKYVIQADKKLGNHPLIAGNRKESHYIKSVSGTAGLESENAPLLISVINQSRQNALYIGYVFAHEAGHTLELSDVDNPDNVMHWNNGGYNDFYKTPFSYQPQTAVQTGTSSPTGVRENQWNLVHGKR